MIKQHLATAKLIVPFDSRQLIKALLFDFYEGWLHCASTPRRVWLILSLAMNLSNKTKWLAPYLQSWVFDLLVVCWFRLRRISKLTSLRRLLIYQYISSLLFLFDNSKSLVLDYLPKRQIHVFEQFCWSAVWNFAKSFGTLMFSPVWPCLVAAWRLVFPKLFCNYVLFTFIIISSDYRCFHFTRICLVLLSSRSFFHKIEDSQRENEAISGNCEIDRSVLFLLWTIAPLSLFTLWPSPENSSLVSQYNLISRTRKIDDSTTETANIRKATCTTSNDFACNPNASNIWLIGK